MKKDGLAESPSARTAWTRIDDYVDAMARQRERRHRRRQQPRRTQPESPRLLLSTLPFLALIVGLGVVAVAVMFAAWPGRQQAAPQRQSAATSGGGVAAPGWFDDAKREMRR